VSESRFSNSSQEERHKENLTPKTELPGGNDGLKKRKKRRQHRNTAKKRQLGTISQGSRASIWSIRAKGQHPLQYSLAG
jgi:hypothetical protein